MEAIILTYYAWLSGLANWLTLPISTFADSLNLPLASALLFGLIGATSPCQLSTNLAALAFLSRDLGRPQRVWSQTLAFVAGKATVYTLVGGAIIAMGLQLNQVSQEAIPVVVLARKALGPLLVTVGLFMLGVIRPRLSPGGRLSAWIEEKVGQRQGVAAAYLLGVAFSFTFCPTLFWLFFGLTIPLAFASDGGLLVPSMFAIGVTLPVLALAAVFALGRLERGRVLQHVRAADVWVQRGAGALFVLIGLHELVLYWLL